MGNSLIINTSGRFEIVLTTEQKDYQFLSEKKLPASVILLPKIQELLSEAHLQINDIDMFGVVVGPGSFTGIRIGVSAIRALCYSLNKRVVSLTQFEVIAHSYLPHKTTDSFCVVIDGSNGVCYMQGFTLSDNNLMHEDPICLKNEDIAVKSKGALVCDEIFCNELSNAFVVNDRGLKSAFMHNKNNAVEYFDVVPLYLRRSQPERTAGEI